MKRIVSLILALSMVLSMFTMSFAGLKDVEGTDYEAAVDALIELGIVAGYPDGTYLPENVVTRAELAKLLVVAYGLEPAAEASKGATAFSDIAANHWASGYINVSADYKFINGYPEGTFKGDATVTYAEAITMCLRVLGYANEIDAKGTWPTNYIAKAQDLKLMDGIKFDSYNDGAKRGNVALLIWNMLTTRMWEVGSESEGDGLVSAPNREMIEVKFNDYKYFSKDDHAKFGGYTIEVDKKEDKPVVKMTVAGVDYEYAGNDFYTFVPGTEVEALINTEEKTLLTIVPTGEDKLVEGSIEDLDEDGYNVTGLTGDYVYAIAEGKELTATTILNVSSEIVDKFTAKKESIKFNSTTVEDENYSKYLVLEDGVRVAITDLEVGDMLSTVTVSTGSTFYVMGEETAEGELTKYVVADSEITVGGTKYTITAATNYVEDTTKSTITKVTFAGNHSDKMNGEVVTLRLDPVVGKVVRIEFDGEINGDGSDTTIKFFALVSRVNRDDAEGTFTVMLDDGNGEEAYTFSQDLEDKANSAWLDGKWDAIGVRNTYAKVTLNEDDEITDIQIVAHNNKDANGLVAVAENEEFASKTIANAKYDDKNGRIVDASDVTSKIRVTDSVVVVKVVYDDEDKKTTVEFTEGLADIDDLNGKHSVLAIYELDEDAVVETAKYVVMLDNAADTSDKLVGIVKEQAINAIDKNKLDVTFEGEEDALVFDDDSSKELNGFNYNVLVYKTQTNTKDETTGTLVTGLKDYELASGESKHGYVTKVEDNRTFELASGEKIELDTEEVKELVKDCIFVLVEVTEEEGSKTQFEAYNVEVVDFEDVSVEKFDRISFRDLKGSSMADYTIEGPEVIFIIRGLGEK